MNSLFPAEDAAHAERAAAAQRKAAEVDAASRVLEEDLTPRGVTRALIGEADLAKDVLVIKTEAGVLTGAFVTIGDRRAVITAARPLRVLDICCGYGVWASEFARWWVEVLGLPRAWLHITGVDIDDSKREHAEKWCDVFVAGGACDYLDGEQTFDLVIGNPAFSLLAPKVVGKNKPGPWTVDAAVERSLLTKVMRAAPVALIFHQVASFQRGKVGAALWRRSGLELELRVPGSIDFRGRRINPAKGTPWASDLRCYCATVWRRGYAGSVKARLLGDLTSAQRNWAPFVDVDSASNATARKGPRQAPGTETREQAAAMGLPLAG